MWMDGAFFGDLLMLTPSGVDSGDMAFGIYFYSTFATSVWLWLYAVSGAATRFIAPRVGERWSRLRRGLDIESRPNRALGYVACVLVDHRVASYGRYLGRLQPRDLGQHRGLTSRLALLGEVRTISPDSTL
jgi:hypothetical protein